MTVTIDNCEREPIHIPGAIQPHGVLLACRGEELLVQQVSANAATLLSREPNEILGRPLADVLDAEGVRAIAAASSRTHLREANPFRVVTATGEHTAVMHRTGDVVVVEIERGASRTEFDPRLRASVLRLQSARDLERLYALAAEEVRHLTGFDRVMVYRFDPQWNGEVVAEAKREDLEPFLGLHYPASDIPPQARRLYTENWLRLIADVGYAPAALVPALDPITHGPLDMSHAALRSVSPIHIQYLKNMGVSASMSISLVVDGVLVGLLACHHYDGAHLVPFTTRETAEYLGQALSWHLRVLETAHRADQERAVQRAEAEVLRSVTVATELLDGLATPSLLELAGARGAVVVLAEGTRSIGEVPPVEQVRALVEWLKDTEREVYATDRLTTEIPAAESWTDRAAGVLSVALSRELGEYVLWFRPAVERTVSWAGDPRKAVTVAEGEPDRLSPRGSFALWRETVRGRAEPWSPWHVDAASRIRSILLGGVRKRASELRAMNERLRVTDRAKDVFIATVSHELRTPINAINGWTTLLRHGNVGRDRIEHAIEVIARNTDTLKQLVEDLLDVSRIASGKLTLDVTEVEIAPLVESVCDAMMLSAEAKGLRIKRTLDTKDTMVLGDVTRVRQIVNNLLANAVKFTPKGGSIVVSVRRLRSDIEIEVRDSGIGIKADFLPFVFDSFRQADGAMNRSAPGLGLGLSIVKKLVELHGGTVIAESEGEGCGAAFRVRLPMMSVRPAREEPVADEPISADQALGGVKVLVVEDEDDSRELLGYVLQQAGAVVTLADGARAALEQLDAQRFDVIVSDVGMPGMDGLAMMRQIRSRRVEQGGSTRAVALTAYTRAFDRTSALRAGYQAHVPKPADPQELITVVASLVGRISPLPDEPAS